MQRLIENQRLGLFNADDKKHAVAQLMRQLERLQLELRSPTRTGNPAKLLEQYEDIIGVLHNINVDVSDQVDILLAFYKLLKPQIENVNVVQRELLIKYRYANVNATSACYLLVLDHQSNQRCFTQTQMHTIVSDVRKHSINKKDKDRALSLLAHYYLSDPDNLSLPTKLEQYAKFLIKCVIENNDTGIASLLNAFITQGSQHSLYTAIFPGCVVNRPAAQSMKGPRSQEISLNHFIPYIFQHKLLLAATTFVHHCNESSDARKTVNPTHTYFKKFN